MPEDTSFIVAPCPLSTPRVYLPVTLQTGASIALDERAAHHAVRVLRLRFGAPLILFNGEGGEYHGILEKGAPPRALVGEYIARDAESNLSVQLAQGISRGERMDYAIQKAVELGVTRIIPLMTDYCVVNVKKEREEKRLSHWRGIIVAACEQSGRTRIPILAAPMPLRSWLMQAETGAKLLFDPYSSEHLSSLAPPISTVTVLIGPEGGLSGAETEAAKQEGFSAVRLGPRMLRTETAPVAALAAVQTLWGDLG